MKSTAERDASPEEQVAVIDATIDDMSPQIYGYFQEKALGGRRAGCLLDSDSDEEEPSGAEGDLCVRAAGC